MYFGHYVHTVHIDVGAFRRAQGHVEHRPILGGVDLLAAQHGVPAFAQPAGHGQLHQQAHTFCGDAMLGIVQIEARPFSRQALAPPGIVGEEGAQVDLFDLVIVGCQCLPGWQIG